MSQKRSAVGAATKAPVPSLFREATPDWSGIFAALSKIDLAKPFTIAGTLKETLVGLFKLKPRSTEEEAFLLIRRAMAHAIADLVASLVNKSNKTFENVKPDFATQLDSQLKNVPIQLNSSFFKYPARIQLVGVIARLVASWLKQTGMTVDEADMAVRSLPAHFVASLDEELSQNASQYKLLATKYSPQFSMVAESEAGWLQYHVELCSRANPLVLDLGVFLEDVYVELRAYTQVKQHQQHDVGQSHSASPTRDETRTIGLLKDFAEEWLEQPDDAIMVISGGPGAGKSAFARRFASSIAWSNTTFWKVLYVPLHRFRLGSDVDESLQDFAVKELRQQISLFDPSDDSRLLIIFDGLDELVQQGKGGEELARDFYSQVNEFSKIRNRGMSPVPVKVLICGRSVSISETKADKRKSETVRHLLPYVFEGRQHLIDWKGQPALLKIDQRDEWWKNYGRAIGDPSITELPRDIRNRKLDPLTAEPILNGLIAQCRRNHKITPDTNRAKIYSWLLDDVLSRVHDKSGKQHLINADLRDIARLLEEVAVTAWHNGDVRATTKTRVKTQCIKTDQVGLLDSVFPDRTKSDISSLFLAFYFQQADPHPEQEQAFEFSHKSFGEFLLAQRIIRFVKGLTVRFERCTQDGDLALLRWVELFGPTPVDPDLWLFIKDLSDLSSNDELNIWRESIVNLLNRSFKSGMPMEKLGLTSFGIMQFQNQNAVNALLQLHAAFFRLGQPVYAGKDIYGRNALKWYLSHEVQTQKWQSTKNNLCGLDLSYSHSFGDMLCGINLRGSNLFSARFIGTNLGGANLEGADLTRAQFLKGGVGIGGTAVIEFVPILRHANLRFANLTEAHLDQVDMTGADIQDADLNGAHVSTRKLKTTVGEPRVMPNGKAPTSGWRNKTTRKVKNSADSKTPT